MGIGTKILLVEDDRYIALALKLRLQAESLDVHVVSGCEAALASARSDKPVIALIDYNLPDGNGLDLIQQFAEMFNQQPVASIMMTASKKPGLREQALERGAVDYFEKPFNSVDLISTIEALLAKACAEVAA